MPQRNDVKIGEKYGKLTVLDNVYKEGVGYIKVQCECGNIEVKRKWPILVGKVNECLKCTEKIRGEKRRRGGFQEVSGTIMGKIRRNAKIRNLEVLVSPEFLYDLYVKQNKYCALSGLLISLEKTNSKHQCTASLDRIDSSKDYTEDNVQWVHKDINFMKQDFNEEYFKFLCYAVNRHGSSKCS